MDIDKHSQMPGKEMKMTVKQALHDKAVAEIAKQQFTFADGEFVPGVFHPTWVTYTNVPRGRMPVQHRYLSELYPDIVVVDTARCNVARLIAEVETEDTLTLETLAQKWRPDQDECRSLYVFVPERCALRAADLILDYRIAFPTALFTYGFDEKGELRLTLV